MDQKFQLSNIIKKSKQLFLFLTRKKGCIKKKNQPVRTELSKLFSDRCTYKIRVKSHCDTPLFYLIFS